MSTANIQRMTELGLFR